MLLLKNLSILIFLVFAFMLANPNQGRGQVFFQYEQAETLKVKRWSAGDKILFRQKQFGDEWISDRIMQILPEDNALVFHDQILHLDEITHIQYMRPMPTIAGKTLTYFGTSWLVMGGLIEGLAELNLIETEYRFGKDTAIIGVTSVLTGYLTQKLWSKAVKKMNDRKRVRIIDLRF